MHIMTGWILFVYSFALSLSSQELSNHKLSFQGVSIECNGLLQHGPTLKTLLSSFGNSEHWLSLVSDTVKEKLPRCSLSLEYQQILLEGIGELTRETLQNAVTILQSNFESNVDTFDAESGYLKMCGTLFHSHSYIKGVTNLCRALRTEPNFKCYFVDVVKDPSVLATKPIPIPWIEIKTENMLSSVIMTDLHPNLRKFQEQAGIAVAVETQSKAERENLAQCFDKDCSLNLARDELLYNNDYWKKEILPHKPVRISYLGDTGIAETPTEVLKVLIGESNSLSSFEIVFVIYLLHPEDCSSCRNALPELKKLREEMWLRRSKFYHINCDQQRDVCSKQNVTGFPTFLAYKIPNQPKTAACPKKENALSVVIYHGAYQASSLIKWYNDVNDMSIHYGQPHNFHEGCNVHIVITASSETSDGLLIDCMVAVCKELSFSECFILQDGEDDIYIKSVELKRRDGVTSVVYEDNVPLQTSFTKAQLLHRYHGEHHYHYPHCADSPASCIELLQTFIKEHSRVPVTELSPIVFHSPASYKPLFSNLPILVALLEHDSIISKSSFLSEVLQEVSVRYYKNVATSFVDVDLYPTWVYGMSPKSETMFSEDSWVFKYPRVLMFQLDDHKNAAFLRVVGQDLTKDNIKQFVDNFLVSQEMEPCYGI